MASGTSLSLYGVDENSCKFKVKLSKKFNTDNYRKVIVTQIDEYGDKTDERIDRYKSDYDGDAYAKRNNYSSYAEGKIENLEPGKTYTFYAYAKPAVDDNWHLAGEAKITTDEVDDEVDKEYDLGIKKIYYKNCDGKFEKLTGDEKFTVGEGVTLKVKVKNYKKAKSPKAILALYDYRGREMMWEEVPELKSKGEKELEFEIDTIYPEIQRLEFRLKSKDRSWEEEDWDDNKKEITIKWESEKSLGLEMGKVIKRFIDKKQKDIQDNALNTIIENGLYIPGEEVLAEILCELIKDIEEERLISENFVIGLVGEYSARYVVGGSAGLGFYIDKSGEILCGPEFSIAVAAGKELITKVPEAGFGAKIVIFPWADGVSTVDGFGATLGMSISNHEISITNFDSKTLCYSYDFLNGSAELDFSLSFSFGGIVNSNEFASFEERDILEKLYENGINGVG